MNSVITSEILLDEYEDLFSSIKSVKASDVYERGGSGYSVLSVY